MKPQLFIEMQQYSSENPPALEQNHIFQKVKRNLTRKILRIV